MIDRKYEFHAHIKENVTIDNAAVVKAFADVGISNFTIASTYAHTQDAENNAVVYGYILTGDMIPGEQAMAVALAGTVAKATGNEAVLLTCTPMTVALIGADGKLIGEPEFEPAIIEAADGSVPDGATIN